MTLHLVGFPQTRLDGGYDTCAYTSKIRKLRKMDLGRDLVVYACEGADVQIAEATEPDDGRVPQWPEDWDSFNMAAIEAIAARAEPEDLLLLAGGYSQRHVSAALPWLTACEPGVGYEGITTEFCAFESHAWRHFVYGMRRIGDGRWFDEVIPNYFDVSEFPAGAGDGGYLLFVGRLIERKGVKTASEIAEAAGLPLVVAGPGDPADLGLVGEVVHVGVLDPAARAEVMGGAVALLAPTWYVEPFGGVAVEAQLCGTPAITPRYGAFSETVEERWQFTTLAEGFAAVGDALAASAADREAIRARAQAGYSLEAVAARYRRWFTRLESLRRDGWYEVA